MNIVGPDGVIAALEQMSQNGEAIRKSQPFKGLTLIDATRKALEMAGTPRQTTQLVQELESGGFVTHAKRLYPYSLQHAPTPQRK